VANNFIVPQQGVTPWEGMTQTGLIPCALRVAPAEITHLKSLVYQVDDHAFVVINPTEEIWGKGFGHLEPIWKRQMQRAKKAQAKDTK
jgi:hypothetical protein